MTKVFGTVLFDLDGTLIDSTELIVESYRYTLNRVAGVGVERADVIRGFGTPLIENLQRLSPKPELVREMMDVYSEYNERRHDELVRPFPHAVEAAKELVADGRRLAIVTGKRRKYALLGIQLAGLASAFPVVITPESTSRGKPHPDPIEAALRALEAPPSDAVMVGDSPHDMTAARAAGVVSAAALWGPFERSQLEPSRPDYWLTTGAELLLVAGAAPTAPG